MQLVHRPGGFGNGVLNGLFNTGLRRTREFDEFVNVVGHRLPPRERVEIPVAESTVDPATKVVWTIVVCCTSNASLGDPKRVFFLRQDYADC